MRNLIFAHYFIMARRRPPLIPGESPASRRRRLNRENMQRRREAASNARQDSPVVGGSQVSTPSTSQSDARRRQHRHYNRRVQGLDSETPPTPVVNVIRGPSPIVRNASRPLIRVRDVSVPVCDSDTGVLPENPSARRSLNPGRRTLTLNRCLTNIGKGRFSGITDICLHSDIDMILLFRNC